MTTSIIIPSSSLSVTRAKISRQTTSEDGNQVAIAIICASNASSSSAGERRERVFNHLSGDDNITSFQATQQIATAQICETIVGLGGEILREALLANPLNYFRMLNSFARLTTGGLKCERHLAEEAQRIAMLKKKVPDPKKGISPSSLHQMEEKLNLM